MFDLTGIILGLALSFFPFFRSLIIHSKQNFSFSFDIFKSKIGFILNSHAIDASAILKGQIDKIVIAPMFGFALLGNYFLTIQILSFLAIIPSSIFRFTLSEDSSGAKTGTVKILGLVITVCLAIFGAFVSPIFVELLFPEYTEFSELMQIMSFTLIPSNLGLMFLSKILAKEKSKHALISNCIFIGFFIIGILIFGDKFEITGIALSYFLASCFSTVYLGIIIKKIRT
jgi:O-antigen/teichoic acid export membrane protein